MPPVSFPYGKGLLHCSLPDSRFAGELLSRLHRCRPSQSQEALVEAALAQPAGSAPLRALARGKDRVVLIASDHTRPVPSRIIVPAMLREIRRGNPRARISILVATGCHRETTRAELEGKFGPEILGREHIVVHDCDSPDMARLGRLPSGGELLLNRLAAEADLLVAEGFIEPHFFAGFSGGRKSVLPGVASRGTVLYNHNAEFIAHPRARAGLLEGNPVHADMLYAARAAGLSFICNVVINADKDIVYAAAGDCELAHKAGREFLLDKCRVAPRPADIAIAGNGGWPLDQNIYQAVKGMTAAEATVRPGGVIIMLAESADGHGGAEFYKTFAEEKDLDRMLDAFMKTPKAETRADQWQSQIFARVLKHAAVIYISGAPDGMVRELRMIPAHSIPEALGLAERLLGNPQASIVAIPDGVSVIVSPQARN
ncbi:MAG: nickel-dependent lactate racemase [Treponema sp.]|nr:nickel-dependent lactate racemase [Treponema sp.]